MVSDKGGRCEREASMRNISIVIVLIIGVLVLMLPFGILTVIFVSIIWTHHPEFSTVDIMVLMIREIILKAGDKFRRKGTENENHHL